ncbi:MAG: tetratricopeptide repeat protein [Candidatus Omnitrophota bacterium]
MNLAVRIFLMVLFYVSVPGWGFWDSLAAKNNQGNKLYKEGKVDEALSKWRDAQIESPDKKELHYNIGNGLYEQKKHEDALNEYEKTLDTKDTALQAKAYYNIGNNYYRMGKLPEAIDAYKKCLDINPDDEDAKYNIEFVRKKIKENLEKEGQDQRQALESEEEEGAGEEREQAEEKEKNKEARAEEDKKAGEQKEDEEAAGQEDKKGEMSKEDAMRLLDAMKDDERDLQKELRERQGDGGYRVEKDW